MPPPAVSPRRFRLPAVLKWTGASLCALIFVVWFASRWFGVGVLHARTNAFQAVHVVYIGGGRIAIRSYELVSNPVPVPEGWSMSGGRDTAADARWHWRPWMGSGTFGLD